MDPDVAASNPPMIIINVDFPAPDGPVIATVVSEQMSREIPFSISTFPALLPSSSFTSFICIKDLLELSIPEDDLLFFITIFKLGNIPKDVVFILSVNVNKCLERTSTSP